LESIFFPSALISRPHISLHRPMVIPAKAGTQDSIFLIRAIGEIRGYFYSFNQPVGYAPPTISSFCPLLPPLSFVKTSSSESYPVTINIFSFLCASLWLNPILLTSCPPALPNPPDPPSHPH
jgi:hypothetical protein